MIRPLRQRHHHIVVALGIFLPVAFAVGIAERKPVPPVNVLPPVLATTPQSIPEIVWKRGDLFSNAPVEARLLREEISGRFAVQFSAAADFLKPDLLVYWVAGNPALTGPLPENATLLGKFDSPALPLPDESTTNSGVLVLFNLADSQIVDMSKPARFNDSMK
jgi:hypothetical protein